MNVTNAVWAYAAFKFLQILVTDWQDQEAFQYGIIDAEGNVLRKAATVTDPQEKKTYTLFHRLAFNIKRILNKMPLGKTKLASLAAALYLIKKEHKIPVGELVMENTLATLGVPSHKLLAESKDAVAPTKLKYGLYELKDSTVTSTGEIMEAGYLVPVMDSNHDYVGNILGKDLYEIYLTDEEFVVAALDILELEESEGAPTTSVSGGNMAMAEKPIGKPHSRFANCDVFNVPHEAWSRCTSGKPKYVKYAPYVGDDDLGEEIRSYARAYPKANIILRNEMTGSMVYLRKNEQ